MSATEERSVAVEGGRRNGARDGSRDGALDGSRDGALRAALPRILWPEGTAADASLDAHLRRHGPMPLLRGQRELDRLWEETAHAGILGRGGAGFPLFRKLRSVSPRGRSPVVVANGTEGEPASDKDKVLLLQSPHLVFDGIQAAARLIGATRAYLVAPDEVLPALESALDERHRAGGIPVDVVPAARGFVAGEASAVVSWVERGPALPRPTPPRLVESGLSKRPTLVQNVETLAHLALVARHGAEWYRSAGTPEEPGTMLVTFSGAFAHRGVQEVAMGTPLTALLDVGGARSEQLGALLLGGYSAAWVRPQDVEHLFLSRESLRQVGASPGAGIVAALPRERCGLVETARVAHYLAGQSAGQCGACVFGLSAVAVELDALALSGQGDPALVRRWTQQLDGRGACAHPDGAARFVRSALEVFADEVENHRKGWCSGSSEEPVLALPGKRRR